MDSPQSGAKGGEHAIPVASGFNRASEVSQAIMLASELLPDFLRLYSPAYLSIWAQVGVYWAGFGAG